MKKLILAFLLLTPAVLLAADKPNPADFSVTVHVLSSHSRTSYFQGLQIPQQVLNTAIDGAPIELTGVSMGVLALGDYRARISTKIHGPHNPNTYDLYKGYDLLLPDGTTRAYAVTGIGPVAAGAN